MLNKEVFEKYGTENWVIEENLCYLLQKYAEKLGVPNPYNPVTFVKDFMKEETYVNTEYAEMSAIDTAKKNIVADYIEGEYKESTNKSFRRDSYADKCR
jgi:hypothetical protein